MSSVGRVISAALDLTMQAKDLDCVTLDQIAHAAGVTPQAVYRYFRDVDDLIETGLRCVIVQEQQRLIEVLSQRVLSNDVEMAKAIVGAVLEACEKLSDFPAHMRDAVFRQYRQIGYDASPIMSGLICSNVDYGDVRHSIDAVKASVALTAIIAVATSFFAKEGAPLRGARLEAILADLFVGVLRSGGAPSNAFQEVQAEFDRSWTVEAG